MKTKHHNQPCQCGSGKKFKKCCLPMNWTDELKALVAFREKLRKRAEEEKEKLKPPAVCPSRSSLLVMSALSLMSRAGQGYTHYKTPQREQRKGEA